MEDEMSEQPGSNTSVLLLLLYMELSLSTVSAGKLGGTTPQGAGVI